MDSDQEVANKEISLPQPLTFHSLFSEVEAGTIDFIFVNPSAYSCIESEYEPVTQRKIKGYWSHFPSTRHLQTHM